MGKDGSIEQLASAVQRGEYVVDVRAVAEAMLASGVLVAPQILYAGSAGVHEE